MGGCRPVCAGRGIPTFCAAAAAAVATQIAPPMIALSMVFIPAFPPSRCAAVRRFPAARARSMFSVA